MSDYVETEGEKKYNSEAPNSKKGDGVDKADSIENEKDFINKGKQFENQDDES